jgi:hypothetical protein
MRRYIGVAAGVGLVTAALSVSGAFPAGAQSVLRPLAALIVNDSENPVPVLPPTPTLRAEAASIDVNTRLALPTGVVFTDFVITSADPDCFLASIGSFPSSINPGPAPLVLRRADGEHTMQLHLTTGIRSTLDAPLFVNVPYNCEASVFWSGYEG